jgi:adenylyl- and sulfurtransferase ThiI
MDCIICRYGEIALKGKNRAVFENQLVSNIQDCLKKNSIKAEIKKVRGRILVFTNDTKALSVLPNVFGLVSISPAVVSDNLPKAIEKKAIDYVNEITEKKSIETFRITTNRPNKDFSKSSREMDIMLGDAVGDKFKLKAKMKDPDLNIGVEIQDKTYIFHEKISCFGGLPIGVTGKVACLVEDDAGLLAAWLMMKRGCVAFPLGRKKKDIDSLKKYSYGMNIELNLIKELIEINDFVEKNDCKAVVSGAVLELFDSDQHKDIKVPVLTPIIGYTKEMIDKQLETIR